MPSHPRKGSHWTGFNTKWWQTTCKTGKESNSREFPTTSSTVFQHARRRLVGSNLPITRNQATGPLPTMLLQPHLLLPKVNSFTPKTFKHSRRRHLSLKPPRFFTLQSSFQWTFVESRIKMKTIIHDFPSCNSKT
jgi:hypothetical protein